MNWWGFLPVDLAYFFWSLFLNIFVVIVNEIFSIYPLYLSSDDWSEYGKTTCILMFYRLNYNQSSFWITLLMLMFVCWFSCVSSFTIIYYASVNNWKLFSVLIYILLIYITQYIHIYKLCLPPSYCRISWIVSVFNKNATIFYIDHNICMYLHLYISSGVPQRCSRKSTTIIIQTVASHPAEHEKVTLRGITFVLMPLHWCEAYFWNHCLSLQLFWKVGPWNYIACVLVVPIPTCPLNSVNIYTAFPIMIKGKAKGFFFFAYILACCNLGMNFIWWWWVTF